MRAVQEQVSGTHDDRRVVGPSPDALPARRETVPEPVPAVIRSHFVALGRGAAVAWRAHPRRRLSPRLVSFVLCVAAPTLVAAIYYAFIAADQYVAEFRFGLRTAEPLRADPASVLQGGGVLPSQTGFDSYAVCLLYTSPSPRDLSTSRMPSSA